MGQKITLLTNSLSSAHPLFFLKNRPRAKYNSILAESPSKCHHQSHTASRLYCVLLRSRTTCLEPRSNRSHQKTNEVTGAKQKKSADPVTTVWGNQFIGE